MIDPKDYPVKAPLVGDFQPPKAKVEPKLFTCDPPYHRLDCTGDCTNLAGKRTNGRQ